MPLGAVIDLGPGQIVLDGDRAPSERGTATPSFRPMCIMAKQSPISATAEHLLKASWMYERRSMVWTYVHVMVVCCDFGYYSQQSDFYQLIDQEV